MTLDDVCLLIGTEVSYRVRDPKAFPNGSKMKMSHYLTLQKVEIMHDGLLGGATGNGDTFAECSTSLAAEISGKRIAYDAYCPNRREFQLPQVTP